MKRGTPEHPKTKDLCARLHLPQWGAVGILESLWLFAQKFAVQGDIGKFSDEAIAEAIGWKKPSLALIRGLVESKWLDQCLCHRLLIHDWKDHCDQTVQRVAAKRGLEIIKHDPSIILAWCYDRSTFLRNETSQPLPLPLPFPLPEALPLPLKTESETTPVSDSGESSPQPLNGGTKPKRQQSPERLEKLARLKAQQESWFGEFRDLFVWKWEGEDEARKIFSWKVKTEYVWEQVKAAVVAQTEKQLSREPDFRTCPTKWLLAGKWKDRKPPIGTSAGIAVRPMSFGRLKQEEQRELFRERMAEEAERRL